MFKIIQTVHHDDGKQPTTYWYTSRDTLEEATDYVTMANLANEIANNNPECIPVTYHVRTPEGWDYVQV